jgi:hypothetical protein
MNDFMNCKQSSNVKVILYCLLSTLLLFVGFFTDYWQVANRNWFLTQNYDMESFVVGRLVKSRQDGIFSDGGLVGNGRPISISPNLEFNSNDFQYEAYINGLKFGSFTTYDSQIGGQGILFSMVDELIPLSPVTNLKIFHALTSLLSAFTITLIVLWFYWEFGWLVSLFVLASAVLSPWLVVFGGKLWWSLWSFYLPMIVIMYYIKKRNTARHGQITFGVLVFTVVFVKCLFTGYEYITTTLIMMMVPFIYYCILRKESLRKTITGMFTAVICSCLAILLSFTILCIQIASVEGSLSKGIDHIVYSLEKRTYADPQGFPPEYAASFQADTAAVVMTYLKGSFFGPKDDLSTSNQFIGNVLNQVTYLFLIFLFGITSVLLYALRNRYQDKDKQRTGLALVSAMWFSLLAPFSWFVIFKAHSFIHTHMNYILWQMPFTLFGFAVCGHALQTVLLGKRLPILDK